MGKSAIVGPVINCSDLINRKRKRRMMYRSSRFKASLAKISLMLMLCTFAYLLVDEQIHVRRSARTIRIDVPQEWLEHIQQRRSILVLGNTSTAPVKHIRNELLVPSTESLVEAQQFPTSSQSKSDPTDDELIEAALRAFPKDAPNPGFIFHNKLPKSGSTTMNNIFKVLRRRNKFNFLKLDPTVTTFHDTEGLAEYIKDKITPPYLLLKHHYWMNFTDYEMEQPTYINVVRHPLDWFTSHYYFHRYGWKRKPGCRVERCGMTAEDFNMTIDECVAKRHRQCTTPWMYIPFFCGSGKECIEITNEEQKKRSLQIAKMRLAQEYYFVGILEDFEVTLKAFEQLLPNYFKGATDAWQGEFVQGKQSQSKTVNRQEMSEESKTFFRTGPLKYEIELYEFAKKLFHAKLRKMGVAQSDEAPGDAS